MAGRRSRVRGGAKLRRLLQRIESGGGPFIEPVKRVLAEAAEESEFEMTRNASDDPDLAASIVNIRGSGGLAYRVGFSRSRRRKWRLAGWRSHFREFGTAPHGEHPGTPARPVVRPAVMRVVPKVIPDIDRAVSAALRRFSRGQR